MTIYIDSDFKSHVNNSVGYTAVETDFFSGKCAEYIEGYRFIPAGETWTRADENPIKCPVLGGGHVSYGGNGGSGIVIIRDAR